MLEHLVFTVEEENEYFRQNPGVHLVKAIVIGDKIHLWVSESRRMNGQHMQPGGAENE
jgi:hypothetical protein